MKNQCIFELGKLCLIRRELNKKAKKNKFEILLETPDQTQIMKMVKPILDSIYAKRDEMASLHFYCAICRSDRK